MTLSFNAAVELGQDAAAVAVDAQAVAGSGRAAAAAVTSAASAGATVACAATGIGAVVAPLCGAVAGWIAGEFAPAVEAAWNAIAGEFDRFFGCAFGGRCVNPEWEEYKRRRAALEAQMEAAWQAWQMVEREFDRVLSEYINDTAALAWTLGYPMRQQEAASMLVHEGAPLVQRRPGDLGPGAVRTDCETWRSTTTHRVFVSYDNCTLVTWVYWTPRRLLTHYHEWLHPNRQRFALVRVHQQDLSVDAIQAFAVEWAIPYLVRVQEATARAHAAMGVYLGMRHAYAVELERARLEQLERERGYPAELAARQRQQDLEALYQAQLVWLHRWGVQDMTDAQRERFGACVEEAGGWLFAEEGAVERCRAAALGTGRRPGTAAAVVLGGGALAAVAALGYRALR